MNKKFIPELHDIGKLVDEKVKDELRNQFGSSWRGHVFVDFDRPVHLTQTPPQMIVVPHEQLE